MNRYRKSGLLAVSVVGANKQSLEQEPTPNPSREGSQSENALRQFPSWEGLGVGRFMESSFCRLFPYELMPRGVLLAITCCMSVITLSAQTNFITLDNYTVHPTRILAKFKEGALSAWSTEAANQIGSRIHKRYKLVPGLAILEEANTVTRATVSANDEETRRSRLSNRIEALRASGLFDYVEPDYIVHALLAPNDQAFIDGTLWGLRNQGQN